MAIYRFYNDAGDCREVVASMKAPPPMEETVDGVRWIRMIECPGVTIKSDGSVKPLSNGQLPVSRSLPRADKSEIVGTTKIGNHVVHELKNGGYCNQVGQRIIDSNRARDRQAKSCGFEDTGK